MSGFELLPTDNSTNHLFKRCAFLKDKGMSGVCGATLSNPPLANPSSVDIQVALNTPEAPYTDDHGEGGLVGSKKQHYLHFDRFSTFPS